MRLAITGFDPARLLLTHETAQEPDHAAPIGTALHTWLGIERVCGKV